MIFDQMSPCLQYLGDKLELIPPSVPSQDGQQLAVFLEAFPPPPPPPSPILHGAKNINRQIYISQTKNNDATEKNNHAGGRTQTDTHLGKCLQTNHCQSFCPAGICSLLEAPWFSCAEKRNTKKKHKVRAETGIESGPRGRLQNEPIIYTQHSHQKLATAPKSQNISLCMQLLCRNSGVHEQHELETLQEHDPLKNIICVPIMKTQKG